MKGGITTKFQKGMAVILTIFLCLSIGGCHFIAKERHEKAFLLLFDTETNMIAYTDTDKEFTRCSRYIYDQLKIYHELYDIYHNYDGINNIKTINDQAGIAPVKVDKKIIDLLLLAKSMYTETNGKMNVAFGSVLRIWHDYRQKGLDNPEQASLPPMQELQEAAQHTDIANLIIDEEASTVYLQDVKMSLDVGAIGKGYATEQVCQMAEAEGFDNVLVSVGGNVRTIGSKDNGKTPWNVGIQNPDTTASNQTLYNVNLIDTSLVTSGNYERFYTVDGKNYHHIIDPDTLMPAEYFAAVTIICPDSGMADCLSTAVFNMPYEQGKELIESIPDTGAVWVGLDGNVQFSSRFEDYIKK